MGKHAEQAFRTRRRQKEVPPQAFKVGHAQRRLLSAVPVHLPVSRMRGDAQHEQQDRRHIHRPEEEPEHSQRNAGGEPQAVHKWVFLGIERTLSISKARERRPIGRFPLPRTYLSSFSALFLTELLPSRAPPRFRPSHKVISFVLNLAYFEATFSSRNLTH